MGTNLFMTEVAEHIVIKGSKEGITILLPVENEWSELLRELKEKFSSSTDFFKNANIIVDLGTRALQECELIGLAVSLQEQEVTLKGILSDSPITKLLVQQQNLPLLSTGSIIHSRSGWQHPVRQNKQQDKPAIKNSRTTANKGSEQQGLPAGHQGAVYFKRTIRSGQKVNVGGNVIVMGDVNPGAEIVAGGDIIIFGALRGIAHAGAGGNDDSVVTALHLEPTQLRISQYIARAPEKPQGKHNNRHATGWHPEIARVKNGAIYIEAYQMMGNK